MNKGLREWQAVRILEVRAAVLDAIDAMVAEHGVPNRFRYKEIARLAGVRGTDVGLVLHDPESVAMILPGKGYRVQLHKAVGRNEGASVEFVRDGALPEGVKPKRAFFGTFFD